MKPRGSGSPARAAVRARHRAAPTGLANGAAMIYHATVGHRRNTVVPRTFRYSSYYWLVDVDALPDLPRWLRPFARFEARDHLGDPSGSLAGNVRELLRRNGLTADRIRLLTSPRVAGYVFNPLSVWYCESGGRTVAVVAEVHNTYGGRHVYLLHPDSAGRDQVRKEFYVSPFLPMGGSYLMRMPNPGDQLAVSIALQQDGRTPFVATLTGSGRPATLRAVAGALLRWPFVTLRTAALIRWQGIRLWLRRVPVQPRPDDAVQHENAARGIGPSSAGPAPPAPDASAPVGSGRCPV